jgi:signal transduction histidine kinase
MAGRPELTRALDDLDSGDELVIARSLVELHGGALTISSTVGVGTCVHVELPIAPAEASEQKGELAA